MDQRPFLLILFTLTLLAILMVGFSTPATTAPKGNFSFYIPQVGRSDALLSDYRALMTAIHSNQSELYRIRGDGSDMIRLTNNNVNDLHPQWSADGAFILWQQASIPGPENRDTDLRVMNADGTEARRLTAFPGAEQGTWSPTSHTIFVAARDWEAPPLHTSSLYITTPTAMTPTLFFPETHLYDYAWSPDGRFLYIVVIVGTVDDYVYDLYSVRADGTALTLLASDMALSAQWSPDSEWIGYSQTVEGNMDAYIVRNDGSETRQLTEASTRDGIVGWVEDGSRVVVIHGDDIGGPYSTSLITMSDGTSTPFLQDINEVYIAPDGAHVVYRESGNPSVYQYNIRAIHSASAMPLTLAHPCNVPLCYLTLHGWTSNGSQLLYSFDTYASSFQESRLFVTEMRANPPDVRPIGSAISLSARWLSGSSWVEISGLGFGGESLLYLLNTSTNEYADIPKTPEGYELYPHEWTLSLP